MSAEMVDMMEVDTGDIFANADIFIQLIESPA